MQNLSFVIRPLISGFRDLKSLLHIDKVLNKSQVYLNKLLAMVMLAYAISLFVGEAIRDVQYAQVIPHEVNLLTVPSVDKRSRWFLYSGPFLLLKQRYRLSNLLSCVRLSRPLYRFSPNSCLPNVRTLVRT